MRARIALGGLALLLAGAGFWWWYSRGRTAPWRSALSSRELATRVLAEHLAGRYPGAKVLVIGNPFTQRTGQDAEIYAFEQASMRGLELGFRSPAGLKVVYPELRPDFLERPGSVFVDPKTTTPLSYLVAENSFDRLIEANLDCPVVVSLIGLPLRIRESQVWRDTKQRFALLLPDWRMVGGVEAIRQAVQSEKIAAGVMGRPGAPTDDKPSQTEYREEFEQRFLLVTKTNVDELLKTYPQLF